MRDSTIVGQLFIQYHTIKGAARTFKLSNLADKVHTAEDYISSLRGTKTGSWNKVLMIEGLQEIKITVAKYKAVLKEKVSKYLQNLSSDRDDPSISEVFSKCKKIINEIQGVKNLSDEMVQRSLQKINIIFEKYNSLELTDILSDLIKSCPDIARSLGKPAPKVNIITNGMRFGKEYKTLLSDVFTHCLRNSLDHGIELPAEREHIGKPPSGEITILCKQDDSQPKIEIFDDGRGLNMGAIRKKAQEVGQIAPGKELTDDELCNFIFYSGLSTAEKVTSISGRGVGMDAVRSFLREKNMDIVCLLTDQVSAPSNFRKFKLQIILNSDATIQEAA